MNGQKAAPVWSYLKEKQVRVWVWWCPGEIVMVVNVEKVDRRRLARSGKRRLWKGAHREKRVVQACVVAWTEAHVLNVHGI